MTAQDMNVLSFLNSSLNEDEEFSSPIDITDIITICKEYNKLGWQVQNQVENILELGVEESIKSGFVKQESLPIIKYFLMQINSNQYFGDASERSLQVIQKIDDYIDNNKNFNTKLN